MLIEVSYSGPQPEVQLLNPLSDPPFQVLETWKLGEVFRHHGVDWEVVYTIDPETEWGMLALGKRGSDQVRNWRDCILLWPWRRLEYKLNNPRQKESPLRPFEDSSKDWRTHLLTRQGQLGNRWELHDPERAKGPTEVLFRINPHPRRGDRIFVTDGTVTDTGKEDQDGLLWAHIEDWNVIVEAAQWVRKGQVRKEILRSRMTPEVDEGRFEAALKRALRRL
jgi:hypothetical protein